MPCQQAAPCGKGNPGRAKKTPREQVKDPVAATASALPGAVALGTVRPCSADIDMAIRLGVSGRRHLTRRSATLVQCFTSMPA